MGDKYIIELEEKPFHDDNGDFLYRVKGFNSLVFDMTGVSKLTPYATPDLEQVRKEEYERGYHAGYCKYINQSYEDGLKDIWDAARKIICEMDDEDLMRIFGGDNFDYIFALYPTTVIEKIRQYEQRQEEQIQVGDVVRLKNAPEIEIWVTDISDEDGGLLSGLALKTVGDNCDMGDTYANRNIYNFERTGKHYDVPTVLEKMRGSE